MGCLQKQFLNFTRYLHGHSKTPWDPQTTLRVTCQTLGSRISIQKSMDFKWCRVQTVTKGVTILVTLTPRMKNTKNTFNSLYQVKIYRWCPTPALFRNCNQKTTALLVEFGSPSFVVYKQKRFKVCNKGRPPCRIDPGGEIPDWPAVTATVVPTSQYSPSFVSESNTRLKQKNVHIVTPGQSDDRHPVPGGSKDSTTGGGVVKRTVCRRTRKSLSSFQREIRLFCHSLTLCQCPRRKRSTSLDSSLPVGS